jgi:hypothetical protein
MGSHGNLSLAFVIKVMVCHFVNDFHDIMTALIVMLPLIVVVEIFLQFRQTFSSVMCIFYSPIPRFQSLYSNVLYC